VKDEKIELLIADAGDEFSGDEFAGFSHLVLDISYSYHSTLLGVVTQSGLIMKLCITHFSDIKEKLCIMPVTIPNFKMLISSVFW
jgi:hypothetical protein